DFANQDVARPDIRADLHDAMLVEIREGLGRNVGNIAGELLLAELRLANLDLEFLDVDGSVGVLLDELFADDNGILEVVAVPGHEGDEHVAAESQLAGLRGGAVRDDLALLDLLADLDHRLLVEAGTLVQADEFAQHVFAFIDADALGIDVSNGAALV